MTAIKPHLSCSELEHRYETALEPIAKSHFHALWLLSRGYDIDEVADLLSFSTRWVRIRIKRYNEGGQWTGPKIARWLARFHGLKSVHDQRGWDALMAIGWSIQQPRPRQPEA